MTVTYRLATPQDLELIWNKNIAENPEDVRWVHWKEEYIRYNRTGMAQTYVVVCDEEPVGECTLILSPECNAVRGRLALADGKNVANINALRIAKEYEGQGHISKLMRCVEKAAKTRNIKTLTIGVEAKETRNLSIYLHWGYDRFVMSETEDDELVLYYRKEIMRIRNATTGDLPEIRKIYNAAKAYMNNSGNPNQWAVGYPPEAYLQQDIKLSRLYVCEDNNRICGVFMLSMEDDPTYHYIEGTWLNDESYGVIHRIASDGSKSGVFKNVLEFCKEKMAEKSIVNLRIDTHEDNKTMQHLVTKYGFGYCGIIYLENGSPRRAYQLVL